MQPSGVLTVRRSAGAGTKRSRKFQSQHRMPALKLPRTSLTKGSQGRHGGVEVTSTSPARVIPSRIGVSTKSEWRPPKDMWSDAFRIDPCRVLAEGRLDQWDLSFGVANRLAERRVRVAAVAHIPRGFTSHEVA